MGTRTGQAWWMPDTSAGTGVYATKHDPARYFYIEEWESGGQVRSKCFDTREEAEEQLAYSLNKTHEFWTKRYAAVNEPNIVIIDGSYYAIGQEGSGVQHERYASSRGFGGRKFLIKRHDSDEVITTTNLWSGGQIPAVHREVLKDNAEFVSGEKWEWIGGQKYLG